MYPGPDAPELGTFVADLEAALATRGHELEHAVVDRRGGRSRHLSLARDVATTARRFRPDVVYAHFLVPAGLVAVLGGRAPAVVTAHGQDVENALGSAAVRSLTRLTVRRAAGVIAVSEWLRDRLERAVPEARGRTDVIDCGVDLARFTPADPEPARAEVGWGPEGTAFVCAGSLSERKNVLRLARAFERRGEGSLAFVGDGPLRGALEGRAGIHLEGAVPHAAVIRWLQAPVVATQVGGPPEFVPDEAGVLVDPTDEDALVAALDAAASLPRPNDAARTAAGRHDIRLQAARIEAVLERAAGASAAADAPGPNR